MRNLILITFLVAACNGAPPRFDLTTQAPKQPGDPYSLLRVNEPIGAIAVSGDYLFVLLQDSGIYRLPKYGGAISTVAEGGNLQYFTLAANSNSVFWNDGNNGAPGGEIKSRPVVGGATANLTPFNASLQGQFFGNPMRVDDHFVYFIATSARTSDSSFELRRMPLGGGVPETVFTTPSSNHLAEFMIDHGTAYMVGDLGATIYVIPPDGHSATKLAAMPETWAILGGIDSSALYLASDTNLYSVPRDGGPAKTIYSSPNAKGALSLLAVDDTNAYFVDSYLTGNAVYAIPKTGGDARRISRTFGDFLINSNLHAQDEKNLYFVDGVLPSSVWMLPKTPLGPVQ